MKEHLDEITRKVDISDRRSKARRSESTLQRRGRHIRELSSIVGIIVIVVLSILIATGVIL